MNGQDLPVLEVQDVGKRFARRLQTSLRHGITDSFRDLIGLPSRTDLGRDEFWALDNVSFSLKRGESLGLLGANGAGKSTLLKIIAGLVKPDRGQVTIRGRVGALIELGAGMHPLLSGRENIRVNASILGLTTRETNEKMEEIIAFADLGEFIDSPVQSYSSGMRVRLGFAVAAHLDPDLLLIDEVLAVGDTAFRLKCYQRILNLREQGTVIVLVSHQPIDLLRVSRQGAWLQRGILRGLGPIHPLLADYSRSQWQEVVPGTPSSAVTISDVTLSPETVPTDGDTECIISLVVLRLIPRLRVLIHVESTQGDMLGSFSSNLQSFNPTLKPGRHRLRLVFKNIPLLTGDYFLHVSLLGDKIEDHYDQWRHKTILHVDGIAPDPFGFGVYHHVHFKHAWLPPETL